MLASNTPVKGRYTGACWRNWRKHGRALGGKVYDVPGELFEDRTP